MSLLREVEPGGAFFKCGIFGMAGSGKTFTAQLMASGLVRHFKLPPTIAYFDTENGTPYVQIAVGKDGCKLLAPPPTQPA